MTRNSSTRTVLSALAGLTLAAGMAVGTPAMAKSKMAAKPAAKKFKAETFMCQHGCKKNITVKAAADMKKTCPVCGCKQSTAACKPKK
jgi:hypothetical protein